MTGVTIVNFSHSLTDDQMADITTALGQPIADVIVVPTHFDPQRPYGEQAADLISATGLSTTDWQTRPLLVNLPSFNAIAALILAQLHGLMGHFPAIIRLRPVEGAIPPRFEFAELIDLNAHRIRASASGR